MIKLIYGVEDNSSVCRQIYPKHDNVGLSNFIDQSIIKNDYNEQFVNESIYSIRCLETFYVFSKIYLVYDNSKRVSYRAYIIVLRNYEANHNVLEEIECLEQQYTDGEHIQQDELRSIEVASSTVKNENRTVYYKSKAELERYFRINKKYLRYNTTYFVDEERKDIINALRNSGKIISFGELNSNDYSTENNENKEDSNGEHTFKQIYKNRIAILLFGILLGGVSMWGHQLLFTTNDSSKKSEVLYKSLNDNIINLNDKVKNLDIDLQKINKSLIDFTTPPKKVESGNIQSGSNVEALDKKQQSGKGQDSLKKNAISQP